MDHPGQQIDNGLCIDKKSSDDLGGTGTDGYSLFAANKNVPAKPSRFQKTATPKIFKKLNMSNNQPKNLPETSDLDQKKESKVYSPQTTNKQESQGKSPLDYHIAGSDSRSDRENGGTLQ